MKLAVRRQYYQFTYTSRGGDMKAIYALIFALALLSQEAFAETRVPGEVSYKTKEGWSGWVARKEIEFSTGNELNLRTHRYEYEMFSNYALLWFGEGKVAIIKINEYLVAGSKFERSALGIYTSVGELTGNDQAGRSWRICLHQYC